MIWLVECEEQQCTEGMRSIKRWGDDEADVAMTRSQSRVYCVTETFCTPSAQLQT